MSTISFIGSGNVATRLATAFKHAGHQILDIYSQTFTNAKTLAEAVGANPVDDIAELNPNADFLFLCVNDDKLYGVPTEVPFGRYMVVHTAGSAPLSLLNIFRNNAGVFYPLQTLSKYKDVQWKKVPVCIEANSKGTQNELFELARSIKTRPLYMDSEQRLALHTAAVVANNLSNYLYQIAFDITKKYGVAFNLLFPLMEETLLKLETLEPKKAQTGPAHRRDFYTIQKHLDLLHDMPEAHDVYQFITNKILIQNSTESHEIIKP